jgi:D-arabinose 1-dehydrogenase-like Zn-dependent alcohol dehydrogenase
VVVSRIKKLDPEKCQKEIFAPLPAIILAGLLTKLSRMKTPLFSLGVLKKGGRVVVNAIRKINPIPELDYAKYVWHEREIKSVANVARRDAQEFLPLAAQIPIIPSVQEFAMHEANQALMLLKEGKMQGAGVLRIPD